MATTITEEQSFRFQIDPTPGESARACYNIARSVTPQLPATLLLFGLYVAVGIASVLMTPAEWLGTVFIAAGAIFATVYGLQAVGRSNLRRLQLADPHSTETHFVEITAAAVHSWCSHVDARYAWTDFTKVVEDKEFYLFVRPNGTGAYVPKRLLSAADHAQLRARLREWSPDRGADLAKEPARHEIRRAR